MKYIIDISPKHAEAIQRLINKETYGTLTQFISTAIENQLNLENNNVGSFDAFDSKSLFKRVDSDDSRRQEISFVQSDKYGISKIPEYNITVNAPGFNSLVFTAQGAPETQTWIWGQVNKIFPVKVGVRILHEMLAHKQAVELNEFLATATEAAVQYGEQIRAYEKQERKIRDEKISAGLPGDDEKSRTRYKFQFLVYLRKDSLLDGAMALMRFCNIYIERKTQMIGITDAGLRFSKLANPVLDNRDFAKSLSEEEALFYISHSRENIKGEYQAMKWLLKEIGSGNNERESINKAVKKTFGEIWKATDAVVNTQRAGLTARAFELGILEKEKEGIYVKYRVSDWGKQTLEL